MRTSVAVSSGALEPNMEQTRLHPLWMIEGGAVSKSTPAADSRAREVGESSWLTETSSSSLQSDDLDECHTDTCECCPPKGTRVMLLHLSAPGSLAFNGKTGQIDGYVYATWPERMQMYIPD